METSFQFSMLPPAPAPWNKGKLTGRKPPLEFEEIWAIRIRLQLKWRTRDVVLPNLAIDSTLRSCDLVELKLGDVAHNGRAIPGKFLFFRPDCELLPEVPKPPLRVRDIEAIVAETGADVSAETSRSSWDGSAMDLDMAVGELMTLNGCEPSHHPWR